MFNINETIFKIWLPYNIFIITEFSENAWLKNMVKVVKPLWFQNQISYGPAF